MEYKVTKPKRGLMVFLIIVLVIAAALSCYIAIKPAGVYVPWARFGVYSTTKGFGSIIPGGSVIITDRMQDVDSSSVAAVFIDNGDSGYQTGTQSALVGVIEQTDGKYTITDNGGNVVSVSKRQIEPVVFYIYYLGRVLLIMHHYRYIVWGAWAAVFVLIVILLSTSGNRRAKKNRKQLTKVFEFYGEKYDNEEQDTDY